MLQIANIQCIHDCISFIISFYYVIHGIHNYIIMYRHTIYHVNSYMYTQSKYCNWIMIYTCNTNKVYYACVMQKHVNKFVSYMHIYMYIICNR